ncbi:MAG: hypothetical protein FDZ75_08460 [Actinobacteria bacterium]|nr:MAG: hypothetical protein FDZ75_08460 [Actinomycetota bacterium]
MPQPSECTAAGCHATYPDSHPTGNCAGCHDPNRSGHGGGVSAPLANCRCHGHWNHGGTLLAGRPCEGCHQPAWPAIPRHPASLDASHAASITGTECHDCHTESLTREHYRYQSSAGARNDCWTCHASSNATVTAAIAQGKRSCPDCHQVNASRHDFSTSSVNYATACNKCHWPNFVHYVRYKGDTCGGRRCHRSWPALTYWYMPQVLTPYGRFTSAQSVSATSGALHRIHVNGSWVTRYLDGSKCESCHGAAACDACHGTVTHGGHGTAKAGEVTAQTYKVASGATNTGNLQVNTTNIVGDDVLVTMTCSAPQCHDRAKADSAAFKKRCTDCHWPYE